MEELPYAKCFEFFFKLKPCVELPQIKTMVSTSERIAVYSSVFGAYDNLKEPKYFAKNIDYYFVSDEKPVDVYNQMSAYMREGMPCEYGLPEMGIIAREHNNPICIKIMEEWWDEFIRTKSQRDQLSFMYVIWKNGLKLSDLYLLGEDMGKCDSILIYSHND